MVTKSKRCSECRRRYRPAVSAAKAQRTCSVECRRLRRRRLARGRRRTEPDEHREAERIRQRRHRSLGAERDDAQTEITVVKVPGGAVVAALERAMSRAGLWGDLRVVVRRKAPERGQDGAAVTRRPVGESPHEDAAEPLPGG